MLETYFSATVVAKQLLQIYFNIACNKKHVICEQIFADFPFFKINFLLYALVSYCITGYK